MNSLKSGLSLCLLLFLLLPSASSLGRHSGLGASELCEVNSRTKVSPGPDHGGPRGTELRVVVQVGEGYHIAGKDQCAQFCKMTRGCEWWTWYYQVNQDGVAKASPRPLLL